MKALRRDDGSRCTSDEQMREMAAHFYETLFSSGGSVGANNLLQHIEQIVTPVVEDGQPSTLTVE